MSERKFRIRYGRIDGITPKNTLATVTDSDVVYFGIARCNTMIGDTFHKTLGTKIAKNRCLAATDDEEQYQQLENSHVYMHHSGLRGSVRKAHVAELINTFGQIDDLLYERGLANHRVQDVEVS